MTYRSSGTALTNAQIDSNIKTVQHRYNGIPIVSAATLTLDNEYNYFVVTGSVAMTALPDVSAGYRITVEFTGAPLLTHGAAFIMPGGVNIQVAAGDVAVFEQEATGTQTWRCVSFTYAANVLETYVTQSAGDNSTKVATTEYVDAAAAALPGWEFFAALPGIGGTSPEITGIPADVKGIKLVLSNVQHDEAASNSHLYFYLGYNDSWTDTNTGVVQEWSSSSASWPGTGAFISRTVLDTDVTHGIITLNKLEGLDTWVVSGAVMNSGTNSVHETVGQIGLAGALWKLKWFWTPGDQLVTSDFDVWIMR